MERIELTRIFLKDGRKNVILQNIKSMSKSIQYSFLGVYEL